MLSILIEFSDKLAYNRRDQCNSRPKVEESFQTVCIDRLCRNIAIRRCVFVLTTCCTGRMSRYMTSREISRINIVPLRMVNWKYLGLGSER